MAEKNLDARAAPAPCGRFAPSTTGPAHLGTLLAALLAWLDARSRGGRFVLRLEDLDPSRSRADFAASMCADLHWLGLDWDALSQQSAAAQRHADALCALAAMGRLYACTCSRQQVRAAGRPAPDGGWAYGNHCRQRRLTAAAWPDVGLPLRAELPPDWIDVQDEDGTPWSQAPAAALGDPVVRRRDGSVAYQLAVVLDDAAAGVTRVVRGRDLGPSTASQVALQRLFGLARPTYQHHLLLSGRGGRKLAKRAGDAGLTPAQRAAGPAQLCGQLAAWAGLLPQPEPVRPAQLLASFTWQRLRRADREVLERPRD